MSGQDLLKRLNELPGFGSQKSQIMVALLGEQLGVRPPGWREASGIYCEDGVFRSVADVTGPDSLEEVRARKNEARTPRVHRAQPRLSSFWNDQLVGQASTKGAV